MARSPNEIGSVYDFLYVDARRIGVLLSQFGSDGVITELTRSATVSSEGGGGFDFKLAKVDTKEGESSALARRFDPRWLVPLIFLREADELIVRRIDAARIGQIVLVTGALSVSDLSILKQLWDVPIIQQSIATSTGASTTPAQLPNRHGRRAMAAKGVHQPQDDALSGVKSMLEFVKVLPHGTLSTLTQQSGECVWSSLRNESLLIPPSDLMLNHGAGLSGIWNMVGILDALPEIQQESAQEIITTAANPLVEVMSRLGPLTRTMLGRPDSSYGMTPLVIFREVAIS